MTSTMEGIFEPPTTRAGRRRRMRKLIGMAAAMVIVSSTTAWATVGAFHSCWSPLSWAPKSWLPESGMYRINGECVGVTDGSYIFDPALADVQKQIAEENAAVHDSNSPYVIVALLDVLTPTVTSAKAAENVRNALEGAYTAQYQNNHDLPEKRKILLVLANQGNTDNQSQPVAKLAEMTGGEHPLVAVIGLGISTKQTQLRIKDLSDKGIPMVAALLTADDLNYTNFRGLIRVSPTTHDYSIALSKYVKTRTDLRTAVMVYDSNSDSKFNEDLFTASLKKDLEEQMKNLTNGRTPLPFVGQTTSKDPSLRRFDLVTPNICSTPPDVVLFAGRKIDLDDFLKSLEDRSCKDKKSLTVVTASDIGVLLAKHEKQLGPARPANLTVVYAGTTNAEEWARGVAKSPEKYNEFRSAFLGRKFKDEDLNDSEAIMMHDAFLTAATAVRKATPPTPPGTQLPTTEPLPPTAEQVRSVLLNLNDAFQVQGASGTLSFSPVHPGDPQGKPVPVLQFPAPPTAPSRQVGPLYETPKQ